MNKKGFTLVELMVVMAIIAILATAGISSYGSYIKRARDTARFADMKAIETALISYQSVNGRYPTSDDPADATFVVNALQEFEGFKVDPADQTTGCYADKDDTALLGECGYFYTQCDGGGSYRLTVRFEDKANVGKYSDDDDGDPEATVGNGGGEGGSYILGSYTSTATCLDDPVPIRE